MSLSSDLKVLYHLAFSPIKGKTHRERLESFYSGQAADYDAFRARLLQGRKELYDQLPTPAGGVWIEMGGGTGHNLEYLGDRVRQLGKVYVADLSGSLLKMAQQRAERHGWNNVEIREEDVCALRIPEGHADVITFSYSLTMIPDWFAAIENALKLLKPGGLLGVVDFYVARKYPPGTNRKHSWFTRSFWPVWFSSDNVYPSSDHVPFLHHHLEPVLFQEHFARIPYMPFIQAPYYQFIGKKRT